LRVKILCTDTREKSKVSFLAHGMTRTITLFLAFEQERERESECQEEWLYNNKSHSWKVSLSKLVYNLAEIEKQGVF
jgi:hypothetical protein